MNRILIAACLSFAACQAPDPADAPAVEILPESEAAPASSAAAIAPVGLPRADGARILPRGGGCGQEAAKPIPSALAGGGGCGQEAAAMPTGGGCGDQPAAAPSGSCGGGMPTTGVMPRTGGRPSLSASTLSQFPPHSAPHLPSDHAQPTTGVQAGSCGH